MSMTELASRLRSPLRPPGTSDTVCLTINTYYTTQGFVNKCIDEIERLPLNEMLGKNPTALEILACQILLASAGITNEDLEKEVSNG